MAAATCPTPKMTTTSCCCLFMSRLLLYYWLAFIIQPGGIAGQQSGNRASTTPLLVPPRIIDDPTNVTVLRNEPATLRCAFDGVPQPEVTWYREGEALEPRGHRLVLPDGALFFLRVTQSRGGGGRSGGGDAGTYWCVARNAAGQARSRNATLTVAYLQADFRRIPESTRAVVGDPARFHCLAPKGQPEPEVTWRKNGVPIEGWDDDLGSLDKERVHVEETGDLIIRHVLASDEGKYQCVAHNMAATRESPAVSLSVYVRPQVSVPHAELVIVLGEEAVFECQASGDPAPRLLWRRLDSSESSTPVKSDDTTNRSTFKIQHVALADAGQYVCEVENAVGKASAVTVLTVLVPPSWNVQPPPQIRNEAGQSLNVDCSVNGIPPPLIFWRREVGLLDVGSNGSRWQIAANGTLSIRQLETGDAGPLYCAAINPGGALLARVNLDVTVPALAVPIYFQIGPANQTLPIRSPALLQCHTQPDGPGQEAEIRWTRNGQPVNQSQPGLGILPTGSLQIDHLQPEDSGIYTCWATSKQTTQISSWTATLLVENPINPNVAFNRAPSDPLALPGPPSQPIPTNQTAHSVTIMWQSSSRMGASPLVGYTVEIYSPSSEALLPGSWTWGETSNQSSSFWLVAVRKLKANTFTIEGLKAGSWLLCLVRAENSHGLSLPSPISQWIHSAAHALADPDVAQTRDLLSGSLMQLDRVQAISSTAVQLHWDIVDGESYIEGLYLFHFETATPTLPVRSTHTVKDPGSMTYTLSQLRPDTNYTVFLVPFYGTVEGRPSNSRTVRTNPDAPSGYPQNVTIRQFNESSVLVQWLPPPVNQRNGIISAYQIFVYSAETNMLLANLTLPSTSTSIAVGGLEGGTRYAFRAAAWTQVGLGPSSPAVILAIEINQSSSTVPMTDQEASNPFPTHVAQETLMIILVGGTLLVLLLTVILVVIVRRRKVCRDGNRSRSSARGNQSNHLLWPLPSHQPWTNHSSSNSNDPSKDVHPQLGPDYAEVFHHANPSMSSFASSSQQQHPQTLQPANMTAASAYASTTLIRNSSASLPFRYQPSAAGRSVPQLLAEGSVRNSSQPLVPNWLELLPPPPQHPPPPLVAAGSKIDYQPHFLTATLPSTIHAASNTCAAPPSFNPAGGGQHYPFRSSFNNAQSQPTLLPNQHTRNSLFLRQSQHRQSSRYQSEDLVAPQEVEGLYATCTYDQIEPPYPLSSYR
uniref:Receptor-type tyrosine-protein phosphatase alpha n=1 Tax=Daphnia magna TaxID=35525 RepID=A0A0P4YGA7_9CRUS